MSLLVGHHGIVQRNNTCISHKNNWHNYYTDNVMIQLPSYQDDSHDTHFIRSRWPSHISTHQNETVVIHIITSYQDDSHDRDSTISIISKVNFILLHDDVVRSFSSLIEYLPQEGAVPYRSWDYQCDRWVIICGGRLILLERISVVMDLANDRFRGQPQTPLSRDIVKTRLLYDMFLTALAMEYKLHNHMQLLRFNLRHMS